MQSTERKLTRDERGITMTEYGFVLVLLLLVCAGAVSALATALSGALQKGATTLNGGGTGSGAAPGGGTAPGGGAG